MIRYRLQCADGHEFEAWFRHSGAYDRQARRGQITCPDCGSTKVEKALMAPSVATARKKAAVPAPVNSGDQPAPRPTPQEQKLVALMRELRQEIVAQADYVGSQFPEEARKIHYKETEPRGIYGEATPADVKSLKDEGIECFPLPVLPEDHN
jgi:hypothetical protein